jgi:hypothetical protein
VIEQGELEHRTIASGARAGEINLEDCVMCMHFVHASPFFFCPAGGYSDSECEPHFGHHFPERMSDDERLGPSAFDPPALF